MLCSAVVALAGRAARSSSRRAAASGVLAAAIAGGASAQNVLWVGGASGTYQEPSNWSSQAVPTFGNTAVLNTSPSMTIDLAADVTVGRVLHAEGDLTLNLNGHRLDTLSTSAMQPSFTSTATVDGEGDVEVVGGVLSGVFGNISDTIGDESRVFLRDASSRLEFSESLRVGALGVGGLRVENGAGAEVLNDLIIGETLFGTGSVLATGSDVLVTVGDQIQVGAQGDGTLRLEAGADATSANLFVASFAGSEGELFVVGEGTRLIVGNSIGVGFAGPGMAMIQGGGLLSGGIMRVAFNPDSSGLVTVTGEDSTLEIDTSLIVGASGDGEILVTDGGLVRTGDLSVSTGGSVASVIVEGDGSLLDVETEATFGSLDSGILEVRAGGRAEFGAATVGRGGLLVLEDGLVEAAVILIEGEALTPTGGTRGAGRGGLIETGVFGRGTINADVTLEGPMKMDPFEGVIAIDGDLTMDRGAVLTMRVRAPLGGTPRSDRVDVTGAVTLGGTLVVLREVFLSPSEGTRVRLIDGSSDAVGAFERIESPALSNGLRWVTVAEVDGVDLVAARPGDLDGDGAVDASDLAQLIGAWGQANANADLDGDGEVGPSDLAALIGAWG